MVDTKVIVAGIDLGTTYSCIAYVDEYGKAVVVPNSEGQLTTPSAVLFEGSTRVVGLEAKHISKARPGDVVEIVKRQMGNSDWSFEYEGTNFSPEEISSYILSKVVADAESQLGFPLQKVVITCPAYFGISEKMATENAGRIAKLDVLAIIHEPVAAAIAWRVARKLEGDQRVLVYDLGGGTFDVTYIDVRGGSIDVVATGGNHDLGGRNWDEVIVGYLADQWMNEHGIDQNPLDDAETQNELFLKAEDAKKAISAKGSGRIGFSFAHEKTDVNLDRATFDGLTSHLLERTVNYTRTLLSEAEEKGYPMPDVILLVGGSTFMPQVAERIEREFGMAPQRFDPDQAVAKGAAIYAHLLANGAPVPVPVGGQSAGVVPGLDPTPAGGPMPISVSMATSRGFGVVAWVERDGEEVEVVSNIIVKNAKLPARASQVFGTRVDAQSSAAIQYMENEVTGDGATVVESKEVGTAVLSLPAGLPRNSPIEITFELDAAGLLRTTARELSEGRTVQVDVRAAHALTPTELEEATERTAGLIIQ